MDSSVFPPFEFPLPSPVSLQIILSINISPSYYQKQNPASSPLLHEPKTALSTSPTRCVKKVYTMPTG